MAKGKLIVIEGIDGSGKQTQIDFLFAYYRKQKVKVKKFAYPRYDQFYGRLVKDLLFGKLGKFSQINPYLAALPYALDRLKQRDDVVYWLKKGYLVLCDRYVPSSLAHQSAKGQTGVEQKQIRNWIEEMEYGENKLPRPDKVIILDLPIPVAQKWMKNEAGKGRKRDEAEKNAAYQTKVSEIYRQMARSNGWSVVAMTKNNRWLKVNEIAEKIILLLDK